MGVLASHSQNPALGDAMRKQLLHRLLLLVASSALLVEPDSLFVAQEPQPQSTPPGNPQATIPVRVNLVQLRITVKDQTGVLVPDLARDEFRVFDDQVEQQIRYFSSEALPLSLLVLIDDDLKSSVAQQMVASLHALAAGISGEDEAQICRFDLKFYPGDGFTEDPDQLIAQLNAAQKASGPSTSGPVPFVTSPSTHPRGVGEPPNQSAPISLGSRPTKALDDAIFSAVDLLKDRGQTRRKIILVVSDGLNGAVLNHHTYEATIAAILHTDISVYSLAVGSTSFKHRFSRLRSYANDSGGDTYYAEKSGDMEKLYSKIAEQARREYSITYTPAGNKQGSQYHTIEVRTARPGIQVKTRQGYYTPERASPGPGPLSISH